MSSQTENKFKSTTIYEKYKNVDSTDGSILADVNLKRDLTVQIMLFQQVDQLFSQSIKLFILYQF